MTFASIDSKVRAVNTFIDLGVMDARRMVIPNWHHAAIKKTEATSRGLYAWMNDVPVIGTKLASGYAKAGVSSQAFELYSEEQGMVIEIKKPDIRDDRYGVFGDLPGKLGRRIEEFPQDLIWDLFKEGDQTTYNSKSILSFDGLAFFHDSHLTNGRDSSGGTYDNLIGSTALTKANLEAMIATLAAIPDNQGKAMNQQANRLIVPPQLSITAADILMAMTISTGGQNMSANDQLAARGKSRIEIVEVPQLTGDPTVWYLASVTDGRAPMIWQETEALHITPLIAPTDLNVLRDNLYIWYVTGESGVGFADPRTVLRCTA